MIHEHELGTICPFCDIHHEVATRMRDDRQPEDGDVTLCSRCGQFGVFDRGAHGKLRKPTPTVERVMARDDRLTKVLADWRKTRQ